jgi:predicted RNA polymerase sigma factor
VTGRRARFTIRQDRPSRGHRPRARQGEGPGVLERWPTDGVPDNPGAWLMTTAKRRALDGMRYARIADAKHMELARDPDADPRDVAGELADALDDDLGDDLLRLVFTACHPVLPTEARVALTLRLVGGLATSEIARAFLVPEPTIAQRIVRAKRTLPRASASSGHCSPTRWLSG